MPSSLLEKIYYRLPVTAQNWAFSAYGLHSKNQRYKNGFDSYLRWLKESEWWSRDRIAKYQEEQFLKVVRHAYNTVPFYRDLYDRNGVHVDEIKTLSDIEKLPVVKKDDVRKNNNRLFSTCYNKSRLVKGLTSGTSGTPLVVLKTKEGINFQWAIWWRHKSRFGLTTKDRSLMIGARVPVPERQSRPPYWRYDFFQRRAYLSSYHVSEYTVGAIAKFLNKSHFVFYTGYPSAIFDLARLLDESGIAIHNSPEWIVTGSDALLPSHEALVERVFGARVTEQYGMAEFAGNISKCERGIFHVDFECGFVEAKGSGEGEMHRLLLTGWGNPAMPFIRYEVGDSAVPLGRSCDCGRHSFCFREIQGRLEDYVVTPDGRRLTGMNQVFEYATNAREMQIYQKHRDSIEVRVVPGENFGQSDIDSFLREFRRRAGDKMAINFSMVDKVERSSADKIKAVISEIYDKVDT